MAQRFAPKIGLRGTAGYAYYELSLAQGPVGIGVTGENRLLDFIGTAWLLVMTEDRNLHLYRQTAVVGEWAEVTTLLPPVFDNPLPVGARRVSFAFDQSARITVAYEVGNEVFVTQWDASAEAYVQRGPYAGVDPFVTFDATWAYDIPASDVLLFYLDADTRSRIMCRVQRDFYSIPYELFDYGEPSVLDRVTRLPSRYQILASNQAGEPLEDVAGRVGLLSDLYPYLAEDILPVSLSMGNFHHRVAGSKEVSTLDVVLSVDAIKHTVVQVNYSHVSEPESLSVLVGIDGFEHRRVLERYEEAASEELTATLSVSDADHRKVLDRYQVVTVDELAVSLSIKEVEHREV